MIQRPTYEQQWQKITSAYMRDEIKPFKADFCFCGNLCDNDDTWFSYYASTVAKDSFQPANHHGYGMYSGQELGLMEYALLNSIHNQCRSENIYDDECIFEHRYIIIKDHPNYEQAVYEGMVAALEVLRQIHEAKGDLTAKTITLKKRELCGF